MRLLRHCSTLPIVALLAGSSAWAAVQGELGNAESTATTTITLSIEPHIQISNVSDIELEVADRSQDISFEERICVRGNLGSRYHVIAAGQDGSENPFQLLSELGDTIPYELFFRGDLSQTTGDQLNPGEASPFYAMQTVAQNCDGDDTAAFTVVFRSENLLPAQPGVYSGFLTLTVAAE
ncbi:hypothetical protein F6455_04400 [Proteobacteria bacterium 005FR1]|nr:hypothetical protein [Proteobacteria bacterium 005FR1]